MNTENIGWVVSLWIDSSQTYINSRKNLPYLSWSPYDRVTIEEITVFSSFFKKAESLNWNGTVQRLHLIPIGSCNWKLNKDDLLIVPDSDCKKYGLYCIVTARLQQQFQDSVGLEKQLQDKLSSCLQGKDIQWHGFHSLGAEDFVGIFLANDIATLAAVIDTVRQITYTTSTSRENLFLFDSVYSFLGLNDPKFEHDPKANLLVRLYPKAGYTRKEIESQLRTKLREIFKDDVNQIKTREVISGRSCLEVEIPSHNKALACFYNNENAVFNGRSEFYNDYIESSRTYWYTSNECTLDLDDINIDNLIPCTDQNSNNFISETDDMHPISRFILKEYERMINSNRCICWKGILRHQYDAYVKFVEEYTKSGNEESLCMLNNEVQTVLLHINQATTPIYEVPYHNYYYAGSYNDILKMYYGVIAAIFNIAYKLPHDEETHQYEMAYSVNFEAATKVHSSIYTLKSDPKRFVVFHLPYDAFMKFDRTIKLLVHECFHYIAPFSRKNRNFIFLKVIIIHIWEQYVAYLTDKGLSDDNCKIFMKYFFDRFGEFCKEIDSEISPKFYEYVLNDFAMPSRISKLRELAERILELLCNKVNQDLSIWLGDAKKDNELDDVLWELIKSKSGTYFSILETIRRIALAEKEAFCDLNMIYLLDLTLSDYLKLIFNAFYEKSNEDKVSVELDILTKITQKELKLGSFELRIGMILNYYLNLPADASIEEYRDAFKVEIKEIIDKDPDAPQKFYEYLSEVYEKYLMTYRIEFSLHREFFSEEQRWFNSFKSGQNNQKLKWAVSKQKQIMDYVSVIRAFNNIELEELNFELNKVHTISKRYVNLETKNLNQPIEIYDLGDYVTTCCKMINDWGDKVVWFRGVCNNTYKLTPSIFRNLGEELSLYVRQAGFLKGAYYATLSEPTLWTEQLKSVFEHMSFLQHYGMPTSLLDFSDDMLMALHFALNPDVKGDIEAVDKHISQPKVVLFNPFVYNDAVASLKEERIISQPRDISPIFLDTEGEELKKYYVYDMSKTTLDEYRNKYHADYVPNPRDTLYPIPIAIRRANARINAQNGTFVAYNLDARPADPKRFGDYYLYLALESIQEEYWDLLTREERSLEKGTFLKEVYINKLAVSTIKKQLETMHITAARAYPEIFRIFEEHMSEQKSKDK